MPAEKHAQTQTCLFGKCYLCLRTFMLVWTLNQLWEAPSAFLYFPL